MRYTIRYVGLQVRDLDRSVAFYRDVLGMELRHRGKVPETGGELAELVSPGSPILIELNWYPEGSAFFKGPYRNGDEMDHLAFECDDVEAAYRELLQRGARPGFAPFREGDSLLAYVQDPDGIWIELFARASGDAQG
jgi:lactoylglutathione lyase